VTVVLRFQLELLPSGRGSRRRPIADGYEDPSPHALRDLAAAKARVLRPADTP
jgi:hypothetical protein